MAPSPETVARRLIEEGFNEGKLDVLDELIAPDMVEHQDHGPDHPPGAEGMKAVVAGLRTSFSDFRLQIEDLAVAGENVWLRSKGRGTNDGEIMGGPPTGRTMEIDAFDIVRVVDGRVVEHWGLPDRLATLQQLGLM